MKERTFRVTHPNCDSNTGKLLDNIRSEHEKGDFYEERVLQSEKVPFVPLTSPHDIWRYGTTLHCAVFVDRISDVMVDHNLEHHTITNIMLQLKLDSKRNILLNQVFRAVLKAQLKGLHKFWEWSHSRNRRLKIYQNDTTKICSAMHYWAAPRSQ